MGASRLLLSLGFILSTLHRLPIVVGQGCENTCPPINFGNEVQSVCEGDTIDTFANVDKIYPICYPTDIATNPSSFAFKDFRGPGRITIVANYFVGCNAGRRESGVFAHVAQRFYNEYGNNRITFIQSIKGGGSCDQWSDIYRNDAKDLYPNSNVVPKEMPLSVKDDNYEIRDDLFTTPFGHPAYVIMDEDLKIRHKFIGPCCGFSSYDECTATIAKSLDVQMTGYINALIAETGGVDDNTPSPTPVAADKDTPSPTPTTPSPVPETSPPTAEDCQTGDFSQWSECSVKCGITSGIQFRWRNVSPIDNNGQCPSPMDIQSCTPQQQVCLGDDDPNTCIAEFGGDFSVETVASGFSSPRDVAFHPSPGMHLGNYSEGRNFHPNEGEEAWVVNGGNHSVSIVASLGSEEHQTTISRRDRGYYHYNINASAISFNHVSDSGRTADRDGFNYFAVCNDDANTYIGTKEPNFFMGPTLYNSDPKNRNLVNRLGEVCRDEEPCHFLHSDMLHEAPVCIGIVHDPEVETTYGNVYWAFDSTGNRNTGQLVRFDFQQPHGPGSMDHSVAAVRRFVEVELERGPAGVHAGMVVHPTLRKVFIAVPGGNRIIVVDADSGSFARTAREEYPIFSNRLPSFEYSIYECAEKKIFAENIQIPSGMALSNDGERLFVAERETGNILIFEIASGALLHTISTEFKTIGGMAIGPLSSTLFFVDDETNTLNKIQSNSPCLTPFSSRVNTNFISELDQAEKDYGGKLSLMRDYMCTVNPVIPNTAYFDQVHNSTGYADINADVQSVMAGMDDSAVLLANRTDCGHDSELNFDALLLGGYYCHMCLPENNSTCDVGGQCSNVHWLGYTCDNEFIVSIQNDLTIEITTANGSVIEPKNILLNRDVTYRFTVLGNEKNLGLCSSFPSEVSDSSSLLSRIVGSKLSESPSLQTICATKAPLLLPVTKLFSSEVKLFAEGNVEVAITLSVEDLVEEVITTPPIEGLTDDVVTTLPVENSSKKSTLSGGIIAAIMIGCVVG